MSTTPLITRRRALGVFAAAATATVLSACSSSNSSGSGSSASSAGGVTLKAGVFSWTAASIETEILAAIAKKHPELGVSAVNSVTIDPAPGWIGLGRGDIDLLTEVNLPNQQTFADQNSSTTELLSKTYGGATQGWFVPKYLVQDGGAAAGLTSVSQLSASSWADKVGGALYDADPGWVTTTQNDARIKAFNLKLTHKTSSEAALIAQVERAYSGKQPIVFYFYHPHWLFTKYDLVQLSEPNPFQTSCFTSGGPSDCAIPTLEAWIGARKDLATRAPKFQAFLKKFTISLDEVQQLLAKSNDTGAKPPALAADWVSAHAADIAKWV